MRCFCCDSDIKLARKVKIRRLVGWTPTRTKFAPGEELTPAELAEYTAYCEQVTYRWAVICHACYRVLDNTFGLDQIGEHVFNIAATSRGDKACIINDEKYRAWQVREAKKLGIDPE